MPGLHEPFDVKLDKIDHAKDNLMPAFVPLKRIRKALLKYAPDFIRDWYNPKIKASEGVELLPLEENHIIVADEVKRSATPRTIFLVPIKSTFGAPKDNYARQLITFDMTVLTGRVETYAKTDAPYADSPMAITGEYAQHLVYALIHCLRVIPVLEFVKDWPIGHPPGTFNVMVSEERTNRSGREEGSEITVSLTIEIGPVPLAR